MIGSEGKITVYFFDKDIKKELYRNSGINDVDNKTEFKSIEERQSKTGTIVVASSTSVIEEKLNQDDSKIETIVFISAGTEAEKQFLIRMAEKKYRVSKLTDSFDLNSTPGFDSFDIQTNDKGAYVIEVPK